MGIVLANIRLSNPVKDREKAMDVICMVDTASTYLCIPLSIANKLNLKELETRQVMLANGSWIEAPYAGPVKLEFEDRMCFAGALVMGDQCLLGAIPMEDMDLMVHPKLLKLSVNPQPQRMIGSVRTSI